MPDLVVVPTPLRRSRAEERLCEARDGLLLGMRVSTLPHLVPGLLAGAGERRMLLAPLAERLLALEAGREVGMLAPAGAPGGAGRAAIRLLTELRGAEVSGDDLRGAAGGAPGRVGERLAAAAALLEAYERRLAEHGALDAAGALRAAVVAAERGARSEETADLGLLVLEGLLPASRAALDLGTALARRAHRVVARLPFLPAEAARATAAEPWVRRLESLHDLAARRAVSIDFPRTGALPGRVVALPATDDPGQCDAAARLAASLVDAGADPAGIALVAPRRLLELLPAAFARLGVPLAVPVSRPLLTIPLVRDVRTALGAAGGLDRTAATALLSSPWLGPPEPVPGLRALLDRAGVLDGRGDPESRLRERAASLGGERAGRERTPLLRAAGAVRSLERKLAPLRGAATPAGWSARLRGLLDRSALRARAEVGEGALARRDLAAIARLEDLVDDLSRALAMVGRAGERIPRAEFVELLDVALARSELPGGSGPAVGAVQAWPLEEAPGLASRTTLVLGAERGTWPGEERPDPLLGNAARERLQAHLGRRALPTAFHRRSEAELRALCALGSPEELLAVAWNRGAAREGPAPLAAEALARGDAEELSLAVDPPLAAARGADEALRAAVRLVRAGRAGAVAGALAPDPELSHRASDVTRRGEQERERRDAWAAGRSSPSSGQVPADLPAWRDALPVEWSATDLEAVARCPFRFLLRHAGVEEPAEGALDLGHREEGALLHAALESFVRQRCERGAWPPDGSPDDRAEARRVAEQVFARFREEGRLGDPAAWEARREILLRRLERFVEREAGGDPALRPLLLEWDFGGGSGRPPLAIPAADGEILVKGRIDRVDADAGRIRVLDYKSGSDARAVREKLSPDALGRTSFQAPLYLLAAARELPGREQLEAGFVLIRSGERPPPWVTSPADPFLALDPEGRAALRAAGGFGLADGVAAVVGRARAGDLPPRSEDCSGCPYGAVCRFPRAGEA